MKREISLFSMGVLVSISVSSVWKILVEDGFTRKMIEKRAIEIKDSDIERFTTELNSLT